MENKKSFQINLIAIIVGIIIVALIVVLFVVFNKKDTNSKPSNEVNSSNENEYANPTFVSKAGAQILLKDKFYLAIDLYNLSRECFTISEQPVQKDNENIYLIENYEEVLKVNFTDKMIKDFEKKANGLVKYDDKYWRGDEDDRVSTFDSIKEFKNVEIEENKIVSTICTVHYNGNDSKEKIKENKFTLVRVGEDWLIDDFNYSDLY